MEPLKPITATIIDDESAVDRWLNQNDVNGYVYLYNTHFDSVFNFANKLLRNKEKAKDITQHIFTELYITKKLKIVGVTNIRYYLTMWSRNYMIKALKKEAQEELARRETFFYSFLENTVHLGRHLLSQKNINELYAEFESLLTPKQKEVFFLYRIQRYSYAKIAEIMNVEIHTVKKHSYDTMLIIKRYVKENYPACFFPIASTALITLGKYYGIA